MLLSLPYKDEFGARLCGAPYGESAWDEEEDCNKPSGELVREPPWPEGLRFPGTTTPVPVTGEEDPGCLVEGTFIGGACGRRILVLVLRGGGIDNALLYGWCPWWFGACDWWEEW